MDLKTYLIQNTIIEGNTISHSSIMINEAKTKGLFDTLFNSKDKNAKKFLTAFSSFFAVFTGEQTKTEAAIQKICQDRKKRCQKTS